MRSPGLRIYPLLLLLTFIALPFQCISPTLASIPRVVGLFTTSTPANGNEASKSMKTALDHYQIPYDEIIVPSSGISGPLPLLDINSKPKYFLIVLAVGQLSYPTEVDQGHQLDQVWLSALTTDQWTQLRNYELENSVRRVSFDLYPPTVPGLTLANPLAPGCCPEGINQPLHWYPNDTLLDLGMVVGVENPPVFDTESLYHYPAVVGGDTNGTTIHPFMKFDPLPPDYVNKTVAAVVVKDETRQHMMFFMAFASWSPTSAFLDDAWIQWGTKNNSFTGYGRLVNETRNTAGGGQSANQGSGSDFAMNKSTVTYAVVLLSIVITYRHF